MIIGNSGEHYNIERVASYHPTLGRSVGEIGVAPLDSFLRAHSLSITRESVHPEIVEAHIRGEGVAIDVRVGTVFGGPRCRAESFMIRTHIYGSDKATDLGKEVFGILDENYLGKEKLDAIAMARKAE
jgi:ferredoxin-fold anticodon binding domain-containing protein